MTYTAYSTTNLFTNANAVAEVTELFQRLSVDDQLALLWFAYVEMGKSITPAATGAARLQFAEGLLHQIEQMSPEEQLQAMRDLANNRNTAISRSYGILSVNTKLAFWYQLAEMMKDGTVIGMPQNYQFDAGASKVLDAIRQLDFSQQITVLRNCVVNMGVDPLAD